MMNIVAPGRHLQKRADWIFWQTQLFSKERYTYTKEVNNDQIFITRWMKNIKNYVFL